MVYKGTRGRPRGFCDMLISYARVSTIDQDPAPQIDALEAGVERLLDRLGIAHANPLPQFRNELIAEALVRQERRIAYVARHDSATEARQT